MHRDQIVLTRMRAEEFAGRSAAGQAIAESSSQKLA
jgi:hypothetical protein